MKIIRPKYSSGVGIETGLFKLWVAKKTLFKDRVYFRDKSNINSLYGVNVFGFALYADIRTTW